MSEKPIHPWPDEEGFALPAEWEPQAGVWVSWPHHPSTWPDCREAVQMDYARLLAAISRFEPVFCNVPSADGEAAARTYLRAAEGDLDRIRFFHHPTDDAWCRDHGPVFLRHRSDGTIALTDWEYNAWGGKFPSGLDNLIPQHIASTLGMRSFSLPYILEGGSLETDGEGHLLTTESCLLNPNRNQHLSREEIEVVLQKGLGIHTVFWLGDGLEGDDTDGHIDDLTRFAPNGVILTVHEENSSDRNHAALVANQERLQTLRRRDGQGWRVRTLPMPRALYHEGDRLPASYANYLVINGAVLMPSFDQEDRDTEARNILAEVFPDRRIIPLDSRLFVREAGAIHCLTQQQPEGTPARP